MKILKIGSKNINLRAEVTCKLCHSVIEFTLGELNIISDFRDEDYCLWCCPICFSKDTVALSKFK